MIVTNETLEINFTPTATEEIYQNVRTILTTARGSVPLDRDFGIDTGALDSPIPTAQARLTAEIATAVKKYEPRCSVKKVTFGGDGAQGLLKVEISL